MIRVGAHAVADHFGQDLCAARSRKLQLFQDQDARAFADHKSVAVLVEGPAGAGGLVVARESARMAANPPTESAVTAASAAAGNHRVRIAVQDHAHRVADGIGAGGAGRRRGRNRPLRAVANADLPGRHVHDGRGNKERRDLARAALQQVGVLALDDLESADAGADENADAVGVLRRNLQARLRHRLLRCRKGKVNEAPHLARFFFVDEVAAGQSS